jgi:hypothetical protein
MSVTVDSADGLRPLAAAKSPSGASLARLREWEANGELLERAWGALVEQEREVSRLKSLLAAVPKAGPVPAGEYPPMPEPLRESYRIWSGGWLFTAGQMRAYADTTCVRRAQAAPQPAVRQGWDIDAAVEKAWGRFQAAMDKCGQLPPPSIHATAHYGTWLGREAHRHDEPKAGAFRNAARMLAVLEAEIRRLHAELIAAQSAAPVAQRDAREETSIGKAVNRAARDLPEGWEIRIDLERHAGVVHLIDPEGNETMIEGSGELFSDQISAAIDAASSQAKKGPAA